MATTTQLSEARAAYHSLVTGTMARVVVDQNGDRIEYTVANKNALYAYIQQLAAILEPPVECITNGPCGFFF